MSLAFPTLLRATVAPPSYTLHTTSSPPRTPAVGTPMGLGLGRKFSKPLVCIPAVYLLHMSLSLTHMHTCGGVTQLEVSILLYLPSVLLTAVP